MATLVTSALVMTTACSSKIKGRGARTAPESITKICIVQNNGKRGSSVFEDEALKAISALGYQGALTDSVDSAVTDGCSHFINKRTYITAVNDGVLRALIDKSKRCSSRSHSLF